MFQVLKFVQICEFSKVVKCAFSKYDFMHETAIMTS